MKKTNILLIAAAALLLPASCTREQVPSGGTITVEASVGAMTKVHTEGLDTGFDAGDRIAVYAWTGGASSVPATRVVDGVANTYDGTAWTPAVPMIWASMTTPHYFLGIYPVPDPAVTNFTAAPYILDPAPAAYAASDLLIATNFGTGGAGVTAAAGPVLLTFSHAMARLCVNLRFRSDWKSTPAASDVTVTVTAKRTATVNYLTKEITATGTASDVPLTAQATPATGYALSYGGLQVPQAVREIIVTVGGKTYVYDSPADITLPGGQVTTLNLVLGKDKIELGSVSVSDWTVASDLPGGEAGLRDPELSVPLTFEAIEAGAQVSFDICTDVAVNPVHYRTCSGPVWTYWATYTDNTPITLTNAGDKVQFKGTNATYAKSMNDNDYSVFRCSADCFVYGNIMSLIDEDNFSVNTTLTGEYAFCYLFHKNSYLFSHAERRLMLPATTLTPYCYFGTFSQCTKISVAPELPATTLAGYCYSTMFFKCESLTTAPILPATTLTECCYNRMFQDCTRLVTVPALPATTLADFCCSNMFERCSQLTTVPALRASKLTEACYYAMFKDCHRLGLVTCLATDISSDICITYWLDGAGKELGSTQKYVVTMHPDQMIGSDWITESVSGIPSGWYRGLSSASSGTDDYTLGTSGSWQQP